MTLNKVSKERDCSKGSLVVVSAPSGAGKTTLCNAVRRHFNDLAYSISYTTRAPRPGEQHGIDYYFITVKEFRQGIAQGRWAEWAEVHGNLYGTSAQWIQDALDADQTILMDIDIQGARQIVDRFPHAVTVFIRPPSIEELERRMRARATEDEASIALRLSNARAEMAHQEMYRHILVNDDLNRAIQEFVDLLEHYRST